MTHGAGNVRAGHKGLPQAVGKKIKLKHGETVYHRNGHLLSLQWCDKLPVTMLSTIHETSDVVSKIKYNGDVLVKPCVVHKYNRNMNSVNLSYHMLSSYVALKGNIWYRKLLFNMIILNSYILNKAHGDDKMSHANFREYIAQYLITTSLLSATAKCPRAQANPHDQQRQAKL